MNRILEIRKSASLLCVIYNDKGTKNYYNINYKNERGKYTREEYLSDFDAIFNLVEQEQILAELDKCEIYTDFNKEIIFDRIYANPRLNVIETTDNSNGYPSNLKPAVIGFDSWRELEDVYNEYTNLVTPMFFDRKNGWQLWHRGNEAFSAMKIDNSDYGDDCVFLTFDDRNEETFFETEVDEVLRNTSFNNFDDLDDFIKSKKKIYEEICECGYDDVVVVKNGEYYDTIKTTTMSFTEDTKTITIGLMLNFY